MARLLDQSGVDRVLEQFSIIGLERPNYAEHENGQPNHHADEAEQTADPGNLLENKENKQRDDTGEMKVQRLFAVGIDGGTFIFFP